MNQQVCFQEETQGRWVNVEKGIDRMIMGYNKDLMMVKVKFEKSAVGILHSHPHIQAAYIAKGSFKVTINGETRLLREGDTFFLESNLEHGVVCLEEGLLIETFTPCRTDFL